MKGLSPRPRHHTAPPIGTRALCPHGTPSSSPPSSRARGPHFGHTRSRPPAATRAKRTRRGPSPGSPPRVDRGERRHPPFRAAPERRPLALPCPPARLGSRIAWVLRWRSLGHSSAPRSSVPPRARGPGAERAGRGRGPIEPAQSRPRRDEVPSAPRMTNPGIGSTTFGSSAVRVGPVALRPDLAAGLPLSRHLRSGGRYLRNCIGANRRGRELGGRNATSYCARGCDRGHRREFRRRPDARRANPCAGQKAFPDRPDSEAHGPQSRP